MLGLALNQSSLSALQVVRAAVSVEPSLPSYSAAPSTNTFTDSSKAGFKVFSDAISLGLGGSDFGTTESGDGDVTLAANPAANSVRGNALRFSTAGGAGHAFVAEQIKHIGFGMDVRASDIQTQMSVALAAGFWQAELVPVSGECLFFSGYADASQATSQLRAGIADAGDGTYRFVLNDTVSSVVHSFGEMVKARLSWDASGNYVLESNKGSAWASELTLSEAAPAPVNSIRWGTFAATKASDIGFSAVAISDTSFAEMDRDFYIAGSGTRDVDQTRANTALLIPDGLIGNATQARVRYLDALAVNTGTATAWEPLTNRQRNMLALPIIGLTADTRYYYWFEVGDSGGNVIWNSEVYTFKTLEVQGTAARGVWNYMSCHYQTPLHHPYRDIQYTLSEIDDDYLGTFHLGDRIYEANPALHIAGYMDGNPPVTQDEFERAHRDFFCDIDFHRLMLAGTVMFQPDDHETINEVNVTARGSSTLANDFFGDQSDERYPAATTLGELWTNGLAVSEAWDLRHWLDRAPNDGGEPAKYRYKEHGQTATIQLDTRYTRDPDNNLMISAQQMAWFKARIDALPAAGKLLTVVMPAGGSSYSGKNSDCFQIVAPAQYEEYLEYMFDNVPPGTQILEIIGDDHLVYALHRQVVTTNYSSPPANYLGSLYASGGSSAYRFDIPDVTASDWFFNRSALGYVDNTHPTDERRYVRSSGVLVDTSAGAASVDMSISVNDTIRTHNAFTQQVAPTNTRQVTLTVPASVIGANSTSGTVTEAVPITRADLPNEICDPSSANKAAFADGRDIRAETSGGAALEIDIRKFAYDSATNAADADVEIWVKGDWAKDASTDFVLTWADENSVATMPSSANVYDDATSVFDGRISSGTCLDRSGNGNHLTLANISDIAGPFGRALSANGTTSKMEADYTPRTNSSVRTELAYMRISSSQPAVSGVLWKYGQAIGGAATNGARWTVRLSGSQFRLEVQGGGKNWSPGITNDNWQTFALSLPTGNNPVDDADLLINGTTAGVASTGTQVIGTQDTGEGLEVGYNERVDGTDDQFLQADYAELRFYDADLSDDRKATFDKVIRQAGTFITTGTPSAIA